MELLRGGELLNNVQGHSVLSEDEVFKIVYPITDCLSYLHRKGIIHRDIKVSFSTLTLSRVDGEYSLQG